MSRIALEDEHPDDCQCRECYPSSDRGQYEEDLFWAHFDEDEPTFPSRKAFLENLRDTNPKSFGKLKTRWPRQVREDMGEES